MKLTELNIKIPSMDEIDNCFWVEFDERGQPLSRVQMKDVFEWIKKRATKEKLIVELKDNRIVLKNESNTV
jgi:hypothetical protein